MVSNVCLFSLIGSCFILPYQISLVKLILLLVLIILLFAKSFVQIEQKKYLFAETFFLSIYLSSLGVIFIVYGIYNGFQGLKVVNIYVFYPFVFLLLQYLSSDEFLYIVMEKIIFASLFFTICVFIMFVMGFSVPSIFSANSGNANGLAGDFVQYTFSFFDFWLFAIPYVLVRLSTSVNCLSIKRSLLFLFLLICGLVCGRKSVMLCVLVVNLIILLSFIIKRINIKFSMINGLIYLFVLIYAWNYILLGFQFSNQLNPSAYVRAQQYDGLMRIIKEHLFFGLGHAGVSKYFDRGDPNFPYAYELYYLSLIMWTGLVGSLLYMCGIAVFFKKLFKAFFYSPKLERSYIISLSTGFIAFLIGSATNPYIPRFDSMWYFFFVISLADYCIKRYS